MTYLDGIVYGFHLLWKFICDIPAYILGVIMWVIMDPRGL